MDNPEQLSELIGIIYEAALDPSTWPKALEAIAGFANGIAAMLMWKDAALPAGGQYYSWNADPVFTASYFSEYIKLDPANGIHQKLPVGDLTAFTSLIDFESLVKTRFYKEWMQPQGYVDNAFVNLDRSAWSFASFAVVRHEKMGLVDAQMLARMSLLLPHVRRAVLIGKLFDAWAITAQNLMETLDALSAGVFLVDGHGRLVRQNRVANEMLAAGDVVCASNGHLAPADPQAARAFAEFVGAAGLSDALIGARGISLSLAGLGGSSYVAHLLPLGSQQRHQMFDTPKAAAAIFIRKAEVDTSSGVDLLAKRFHLTPREVDVLQGLMKVGGVADIAGFLGISERTVKAHLHNMFAKTGLARQADLVKLVAAFAGRS